MTKKKLHSMNPLSRLLGHKRVKSAIVPIEDDASSVLGKRGRGPSVEDDKSDLKDETAKMAWQQQELVQQGERKFARVIAEVHEEQLVQQQAPEEGLTQENMNQHPALTNRQDLDGGYDPKVSPLPWANDRNRTKMENERREQELELQMRLGLAPKMGTAPKPQTP